MFCASHPVSRESTIRQKAGLQALMQSDGSSFRREAYFQQEHLLSAWKVGTQSRRLGADGTGKFLLLLSQTHSKRGSPPIPMLPSPLAPEQPWSRGWQKHFNCSLQQGYPSLNPVPEATLLLARHFSISRMPAEPQSAWEERSASPTSGKVRTVSASGGGRRRG